MAYPFECYCDNCGDPCETTEMIGVYGGMYCPTCYNKIMGYFGKFEKNNKKEGNEEKKAETVVELQPNVTNTGIPGYKEFAKILRKTQKELKKYVQKKLVNLGYEYVVEGDGFVYAQGEIPVLLVAHMDTVHTNIPKVIHTENGIVSSPQGIGGDDRCGIYSILEIIKERKCHVLFCEDEESGCVGTRKFVVTKLCEEIAEEINYMVEIDRRGSNDLVYYDNDNKEFHDFCANATGYKKSWGTCSDISYLMEYMNRSGVNISSGYYNEHTFKETINLAEMENTIKTVEKLIDAPCEKPFEFVEKKHYYGDFGGFNDWYYRNDAYGESGKSRRSYADYLDPESDLKMFMIVYTDWETGTEKESYVYGITKDSAIGRFMREHPNICYSEIEEIEPINLS